MTINVHCLEVVHTSCCPPGNAFWMQDASLSFFEHISLCYFSRFQLSLSKFPNHSKYYQVKRLQNLRTEIYENFLKSVNRLSLFVQVVRRRHTYLSLSFCLFEEWCDILACLANLCWSYCVCQPLRVGQSVGQLSTLL